MAMGAVMGAHGHLGHPVWNPEAGERAGERLLTGMGVQQGAGAEHGAVAGQHLPRVGIVISAGIGVLHGGIEPSAAVTMG
jgi:hypothetical protein